MSIRCIVSKEYSSFWINRLYGGKKSERKNLVYLLFMIGEFLRKIYYFWLLFKIDHNTLYHKNLSWSSFDCTGIKIHPFKLYRPIKLDYFSWSNWVTYFFIMKKILSIFWALVVTSNENHWLIKNRFDSHKWINFSKADYLADNDDFSMIFFGPM